MPRKQTPAQESTPPRIEVIRHDVAPNGYSTSRRPVLFDNEEEATKYVFLVRDAIDRWGDNALVGLYINGKVKKLDRGAVA